MCFPTIASAFCMRDIEDFFDIKELKAIAKGVNIPEALLHGEEEVFTVSRIVPEV